MVRKTIQFMLILLLLSACGRESGKEDSGKMPEREKINSLDEAPTEIISFFESDKWIRAIYNSLNTEKDLKESTLKLSDYDVLPPAYFSVIDDNVLYEITQKRAKEAKRCRVTIQNKNDKASFWFEKIDTLWQFKDVFLQKVRKRVRKKGGRPRLEKPIIYLYPPSPMVVQVQLDFAEKLTYTYPPYPKEGWHVTAFPDGTLQQKSDKKKFYSLFWEGSVDYEIQLDEGFVVPAASIEVFLESKLTKLGLNYKERQEFIIYWAPQMKRNPYSLVHFSTEEYEKHYPLLVTPKPDSEIRVNMVYKACDAQTEVTPQTLKEGVREGFTLVEWGGIDLDAQKIAVQ